MRAMVSAFALIRAFRAERRGVAAIEFALLSPVFIGLVFGIFTFGFHLAAANSVAQLCGDIARASVAGLDEAERVAIAEDFMREHIARYALLHPDYLSLTVADRGGATQFDVEIEYDASHLPAVIWTRMFDRPDPVIRASATVRHGGF